MAGHPARTNSVQGSRRHPRRIDAFERLTGEAFRAIVERAGDIITLVDAEGRFVYISPAFQRIFGLDPADAMGVDAATFVHPDDRERVAGVLGRLISNPGAEDRSLHRFRHASGAWRWFESFASNHLSDPNLRAVIIISREVTDSLRIQNQLHQVEEVGKLGHWRWARGDARPSWSPGMYRLGDFDAAEGNPTEDWTRFVHPDDVAMMVAAHSRAMREGQPFEYRCRLRHRDGRFRVIATQGDVELDAHGKPAALLCVCQDVTERVEAEAALQASEEQYRLLAANASDVIGRFSIAQGVIYVSPAVTRVLGYQPEELLGFKLVDLFETPAGWRNFSDQIEIAIRQEEPVTLTSCIRHKDGHSVWMESSLHSVGHGQTGEAVELTIISRDISERKRHELEVLTARDAAETANRTKSQFLANMSHELRTPLNAVIGFSEVLKDEIFGPLGSPRYDEYARDVHDSGLHLLELINDVLDMSKIEAGKYELHFESVDLEEVMDTSIRLVRLRALEAGVIVEKMLENGPPTIAADRRAIKQILLNLISNAVKFTPAGGNVLVSASSCGDRVLLRVLDTGIGIPEEDLPRLARPFEQVRAGEHGGMRSGTGLGLALVKALTELHGGEMRIESRVGTGTVVTVELPVNRD